jgi:hypothetical protein
MIQVRQVGGISDNKAGWVPNTHLDAIRRKCKKTVVPVFRAPLAKEPAREVPAFRLRVSADNN